MRRLLHFFVLLLISVRAGAQFQGLIVNEFSQGSGGFEEYIELLVVGNRTCTDSTADLRGWIIDDQNGWYGTTNGSAGHYRFKDIPAWSAVPFGAIILIYNGADKNPSIVLPDDPTDADQDLTYIVPLSNTSVYFEQNTAQPSNAAPLSYVYPAASVTTGYTATTNQWQFIMALNNTNGDVISLVSPADRSSPSFSIGYGYMVSGGFRNPTVSIPNVGAASCAYLSTDNYIFPGSWVITSVPAGETPGLPNGGANSSWIHSLRLARPRITTAPAAEAVCAGNSQQITSLSVTGTHHAPTHYSISWEASAATYFAPVPSAVLPGGSLPVTVPAGTPAGTYTGYLTVQNAAGQSCSAVPFTITVHASPAIPSLTVHQPTCTTPGGIEVIAPIGLGNTYSLNAINYQSTTSFTNLAAGNYVVWVKDANGCTASATANINPVPATPPAPTVAVQQPDCSNGTGTIVVASPVGSGLLYSLDNVTYTNASGSFPNLVTGTYPVTVRNSEGCVSAATTVIIQSPPIQPAVQVNSPVICPGTTAAITATVSPAGNYTYAWTVPAGAANPGNVASFSASIAGTYSVQVTTGDGCNATAAGSLSVHAQAMVSADDKQVCTGSAVALVGQPTGGVWTGAGVTGSQFDATGLSPGHYTVTYTYNAGTCSGSANATITVNAVPAAPIISVTNHCNGTSLLTAAGFSGSLRWNTGAGTPSITVSTAGNYTVTQSLNGCTSAAAVAFANPLSAPAPPMIVSLQQPDCSSRTGAVTVISAGTDITYSIIALSMFNMTGQFVNLPPGTHSITARNSEGCVSLPMFINILPPPAPPPAPAVQVMQPDCSGNGGIIGVLSPRGAGLQYSIDGSTFQSSPFFGNLPVGTYTVLVRNSDGCVSTPVPVQIRPPGGVITSSISVCMDEGGSYNFNGQVLTTTGTYVTTYIRPGSCDSLVRLYLLVKRTERQELTGCGSVVYRGNTYFSSLILRDTIKSAVTNCDSLYRETRITVYPVSVSTVTVCLPPGQTYSFSGQVLTSSGRYTGNFTTSAGCDSTVHLFLTIATRQTQTISGCDLATLNNITYTNDTTITEAIPSALTGCDSIVRVTVIDITARPTLMVSPGRTICRGESVQLIATSGNGTIEWQGFGPGNQITVSPAATTTYKVFATAVPGCTTTAEVIIRVEELDLQLTADPNPVIAGQRVTLKSSAASPYHVLQWLPAFTNQTATWQSFVADTSMLVKVRARSTGGCQDSASLQIVVDPLGDVYIPSAFTPNGDGKNDLFLVGGGNFSSFGLKVFNRWGQVVFYSAERSRGWDGRWAGKEQPTGSYVYVFTATLKDGRRVERKGTVTLIR